MMGDVKYRLDRMNNCQNPNLYTDRAPRIDKERERTPLTKKENKHNNNNDTRHTSSLGCGRPGLQPLLPKLPQARLQSPKEKTHPKIA
jgi:hypothetical protein